MRNKTGIIILTAIISLLCIYFLSFTFKARNIQQEANAFATTNGKIDYKKRQTYLDSLWKQPVYDLGFTSFTYKEVKDKEINLGLDLQGGMHVTMEVSPVEILKAMSGNSNDPKFQEAIKRATEMQRTSTDKYTDLFYRAYQQVAPEGKLSRIFSTAANKGKISYESSNAEVMRVIDGEVEDAIGRSFEILRTRVDKFGVSNPNIQRLPGTGRIQIELPGVDNPERVRNLLSSAAKLEFAEVWEMQDLAAYLQQLDEYLVKTEADSPAVTAQNPAELPKDSTTLATAQSDTAKGATSLEEQLAGKNAAGADSTKADSLNSLQNQTRGLARYLTPTMYGLIANVNDTARVNSLLNRQEVKALFPSNVRFLWEVKAEKGTTGKDEFITLHAVKKSRDNKVAMEGDVISDARQDFSQTGQVEVNMQMNAAGSRKWKNLTASNIGKRIAIILDDNVYSAPTVQNEIPNGSSVISGNFTIEEAKDLANILKAGKLAAPTRIVEEAVVGPSLGQEAITQGLISMAAGLGMVVLFMLLYYGSGGMVANVALLFNIFFIIGILAQFSAVLTLPGIAGIVLTMGMAVDANVLIFERIKEELKNGRTLLKAIELGYDKAYSSIIDSNATTFLTGVILYVFGSGGVKGFAVTLMIGIVCSLFTAVFITRLIMEWVAKRKDAKEVTLTTFVSKNLFDSVQFDFVGNRNKAYVFSGIVIGIGILLMAFMGLNMGVDFKGGRSYVVAFDKAVAATEVRSALVDDFKNTGIEVKTYDGDDQLKITTSYLIDDESGQADKQVELALMQGLQQYQTLNPTIVSSSKVGATMADDIQDSSRNAVLLSLAVIFLYILIRFGKWQYSLGAVLALFHDVLFVMSAFAIARVFGLSFEIDQVFIAAMLTVVGYSINDTVVVFDRIREFASMATTKEELPSILNRAIGQTLSRTIMTSLVTLLVVLILLFFGGEVLRGFSFALTIGIIFGTYSSIFIASPVVLDFSKKKLTTKKPQTASAGVKS
ncbi:protein translocase subunit SecDF [Rhodocytophaga aerolata]|uniref:Multifunctional fusion protein n=1 Tax=Rhodocytophaga aerolata TaxID=455078 RepID=A0ABT8R638_9BACT|nr:protein translocase subunit SecDF [Rhodocytophaga aerolata]MDO1447561.1 protein translocase subunit SecDF [Rhodocytophaga aerolata]